MFAFEKLFEFVFAPQIADGAVEDDVAFKTQGVYLRQIGVYPVGNDRELIKEFPLESFGVRVAVALIIVIKQAVTENNFVCCAKHLA